MRIFGRWETEDLSALAVLCGGFLVILQLGGLEPGVLQVFIDRRNRRHKITSEVLLFLAVLMLVPLVMAFLSMTLRNSVNRGANIIMGLVYTALQIFALAETLAEPSAYAVLMEVSKVVVPVLVIWYAWKSTESMSPA